MIVLYSIGSMSRIKRPNFFLRQIRIMLIADLARDMMICTLWMLLATSWKCLDDTNSLDKGTKFIMRHAVDFLRVLEAIAQIPDVQIAFGLSATASRSSCMLRFMQILQNCWVQVFIYVAVISAVAIPAFLLPQDMDVQYVGGCWRPRWMKEGIKGVSPSSWEDIGFLVNNGVYCAGAYVYTVCLTKRSGNGQLVRQSLRNMSLFLMVNLVRDVLISCFLIGFDWPQHMPAFFYYVTVMCIWSSFGDALVYSFQNRQIRLKMRAFSRRKSAGLSNDSENSGTSESQSSEGSSEQSGGNMSWHVHFTGCNEVVNFNPAEQQESLAKAARSAYITQIHQDLQQDLVEYVEHAQGSMASESASTPENAAAMENRRQQLEFLSRMDSPC